MPVSENWRKICKARLHIIKERITQEPPKNQSPDIWFDVKKEDLDRSELEKTKAHLTSLDLFPSPTDGPKNHKDDPLKYVAMDCEMVGFGPEGKEHALARVS